MKRLLIPNEEGAPSAFRTPVIIALVGAIIVAGLCVYRSYKQNASQNKIAPSTAREADVIASDIDEKGAHASKRDDFELHSREALNDVPNKAGTAKPMELPHPPRYDLNLERKLVERAMEQSAYRARNEGVTSPTVQAPTKYFYNSEVPFKNCMAELTKLGVVKKMGRGEFIVDSRIWLAQDDQIKKEYVSFFCGYLRGVLGSSPAAKVISGDGDLLAESDWENGHKLYK